MRWAREARRAGRGAAGIGETPDAPVRIPAGAAGGGCICGDVERETPAEAEISDGGTPSFDDEVI